jgi:putative spermidine/putrescine transport system substrate-binding protein
MNWSLQPKVQGDVAAWFGSAPAVPAACTEGKLRSEQGCKNNGFDSFEKIAFWKTPQSNGGKYVPYSRWSQD